MVVIRHHFRFVQWVQCDGWELNLMLKVELEVRDCIGCFHCYLSSRLAPRDSVLKRKKRSPVAL